MSARFYDVFQTTRGWVALLASERGIRRSTLPSATPDDAFNQLGQLEPELEGAERDPARLGEIGERLVAYFDGEMVEFGDVELDVSDATDFSRRAWSACRSIPRGETRTYGWLARQAGSPNAPRAAGQTMARNPAPIIVPCHRVVGSDGSLRGFGSGDKLIGLKRLLLDMEGGVGRLV